MAAPSRRTAPPASAPAAPPASALHNETEGAPPAPQSPVPLQPAPWRRPDPVAVALGVVGLLATLLIGWLSQ